ncbi:MAG: CDP-diacylglycerol--glycerol-3-phosphate 3-phosphatidyltransferase [Deltaproteobacteria bacterium]|nr:CDP-diacylglycerol--glycerol-3-phosphate 3-phosphatidyltransferase [Deltaproteobacteria bacterium]MCL5276405.1 CDP-diacylglycerol--glycerol-3-phosphate 3-phosphatidyltransferase [Deltaproteobacteria bacterium]
MHDDLSNDLKTLPNLLSISRVFLIPFMIVLFEVIRYTARSHTVRLEWLSFLAAVVFGIGGLTDFFDGYFARKYRGITNLGKLLDPIADKLLIATTMIMLVSINRLHAWIVVLIIGREIAVTGLRAVSASGGLIIPASLEGKYKTNFQIAAVVGLLIHYTHFGVDFQRVGMLFIWIALFVTMWSGANYFVNFSKTLKTEV